jgi:hypothetical protein
LGVVLLVYLFHDQSLTDYIPSIDSEYSKRIFKPFLIGGAIILIAFIVSGITYTGYAGSSSIHDAPSSMFGNDDTHYFGK